MKYLGVNRYHSLYQELAREIAECRQILNAELTRNNVDYQLGEKEDYFVYLGVLGELITRDFLRLKRIPYKSAPIIAPFPIKGPDLIFLGESYDVKTVDEGKKLFLVTARPHHARKAENYIFVLLEDNFFATLWAETWDNVSKWEVRKMRSDAFCVPINDAIKNVAKDELRGIYV